LLVYGRVEVLSSDFVSVLGQSVFVSSSDLNGISLGTLVAVYGSIDTDTGGIVGATLVTADDAGLAASGASYLTGMSGLTVDYNALLSNGWAMSVGDEVSVTGYHYGDLGVMVADPHLSF
jgi:hypothetical protein